MLPILPTDLLWRIAQASGLGLGVTVILWLSRRSEPLRRVRFSLLSSALLLSTYLIATASGLANASLAAKVLLASAILLGANAGLQFFDLLLWDYLLGRVRHVDVPRLLIDIFNFLALTGLALALLNSVFGVDLNALLVTSTVASAVVGLALQDVLTSIVAGLALQLEQPFRVSDWVMVSGQEGQVTQMNWRTLTLRTRDNHQLILPNANVAKQDIINYSRPTPLQRQHARLGLAYMHPPGEAKKALARTVAQTEGVCAEPAPEIVIADYGEFAIHYDIRYWITDYARAEVIREAVMSRLWYEVRRAGLTIPFPTRELTVRTLSEDHLSRAQEQQRREVFAELRQLALFAPLTDPHIEQLVRGATLQRYTAGEALVRQGDPGDSLFVIKAGRVRVDVKNEASQTVTVDYLGPDDFFGEMSLLTGEPRSASIVAASETEVIVVDKAHLADIINQDTGLLEAISLKLELRSRNLVGQMPTGPLADRQPAQRAVLLQRIRGFLGIKSN